MTTRRRQLTLAQAVAACVLLWVARAPAHPPEDPPTTPRDSTRQASATAGPVRLRAALGRGVYESRAREQLFLRVDLAANVAESAAATGSPPPTPATHAGQHADRAHTHDDDHALNHAIPRLPGAHPQSALPLGSSPTPARANSRRPPLSLALVIDRSGSMAEDRKFAYALAAANLVIENLAERDVLAVVAFSDEATVLAPAGRVVNRAFLRHRLTEIEPAGWTNLSAGLLEAFAQLDVAVPDAPREGSIRRVIVLTDGQANRGITHPDRLREVVESARSRSVGVSTMGCGTQYDESVLRALAEAGGGRYTYVANPEQIPAAMATELEGLLAVAAQNARLQVRVMDASDGQGSPAQSGPTGPRAAAVDNGMIVRALGRPAAGPAREMTIDLGDLRDGETGAFAFELTPPRSPAVSAMQVEVGLTFDRPDTAARERIAARVAAVRRGSPSAQPDAEKTDPSVTLYAAAVEAVERAEQAAKGLDDELSRRAERDMAELYPVARAAAIERRDQELLNAAFLLKHFSEEIRAARTAGLTHGHKDAKAHFQKDADYRRYLLEHHRERH